MRTYLLFFLILLGCSSSHPATQTIDAGIADNGGADAVVPPVDASADAVLPSDAASECDPIACPCEYVCVDGLAECVECPDDAFVLNRARPSCLEEDSSWEFLLVPRVDTDAAGTDRNSGSLNVESASTTIRIVETVDRDPFHALETIEVGAPGLTVERCSSGVCDPPTSGWFAFSTGGAGELWTSLDLRFADGAAASLLSAHYSWGGQCFE